MEQSASPSPTVASLLVCTRSSSEGCRGRRLPCFAQSSTLTPARRSAGGRRIRQLGCFDGCRVALRPARRVASECRGAARWLMASYIGSLMATEEQYQASIAAVHPSDGSLPEGQVFHAAGPSDDGWMIVAI